MKWIFALLLMWVSAGGKADRIEDQILALERQASKFIDGGSYSEAHTICTQVIQLQTNNPLCLLILFRVSTRFQEYAVAADHGRSLLSLPSKDLRNLRFAAGWMERTLPHEHPKDFNYKKVEKTQLEVYELICRILLLSGGDTFKSNRFFLGLILSLNKFEDIPLVAERLVQFDPGVNLPIVYQLTGRMEKLEDFYRKQIRKEPECITCRIYLARSLLQHSSSVPTPLPSKDVSSTIPQDLKRRQEAIQLLLQVLKLSPSHPFALHFLSQLNARESVSAEVSDILQTWRQNTFTNNALLWAFADAQFNHYKGFRFKENCWNVPRLDISTVLQPGAETSKNFLDFYIEKRIPLILYTDTNPNRHFNPRVSFLPEYFQWQTTDWNNSYLSARAGAVPVEIQYGHSSLTFGVAAPYKLMTFETFLNLNSESGPDQVTYYLNTQGMFTGTGLSVLSKDEADELYSSPLHKLKHDIPIPWFLKDKSLRYINLWMGGGKYGGEKGISALHQDPVDNIYVLLKGWKRFEIFSPDDSLNLYPMGTLLRVEETGVLKFDKTKAEEFINFSMLGVEDLNNVDLKMFPRFKKSKSTEIILYAGQALYLPAGWWHRVESIGEHMAINFWFQPPSPN